MYSVDEMASDNPSSFALSQTCAWLLAVPTAARPWSSTEHKLHLKRHTRGLTSTSGVAAVSSKNNPHCPGPSLLSGL